MKFSLSEDTPSGQKQAITADEKLITVGAGAGTGKTWVLSNRYARLIVENDELLPSDILTLTYTEAAAGDMKARIEERLRSELQGMGDTARKRAITDGMADTWISTIHSFAARLIRESGLKLDIDPGASVITAQQEQEFWDNIRDAAEFATLHELARAYGDKTLRDTAKFLDSNKDFSAGVSKWRSETLSTFARDTAELHASSGRSWQEMLSWSENDDLLIDGTRPLIKSILHDEWLNVWDIWQKIPSLPRAKKRGGTGDILCDLMEWQGMNSPDDEQALIHFYTSIVTGKDIKGYNGNPFTELKKYLGLTLGDWRKQQPELVGKITELFTTPFTQEELNMRKILMKFCAVSWGMWDMMKKRRGLLSFSDMINHARETIKAGGVKRKFAHILVDEFQDTDPLQFSMIQALSVDSTNLFAVGDPKQSIYKFRHADPALFAKTIQDADTSINLDVSFRTRKSLLTRINSIFARLWRDGLGKSEAMKELKFEGLNPAVDDGERNSGTMPGFKIFLARNNQTNREEALKNLADELAYNIAKWVQEGRTIWDKQEKIIRPVKFSDFAILSRSRNIFPTLEESLEHFGIRTIQDKSTDYFSRGEINDVVCMLRAAGDFTDDFAVSGWLLSPFSGVSEPDAVSCLEAVSKELKPIELIRQKLPEAYSRLEYLSLVGAHEGASGILALYDNNREWLACYPEKDRLRALRNLRLAVYLAREFQKGGASSLRACAEWLTRAVRNSVSVEEPDWHDDNEDAVRLGAVHSAKGLEYPVTVIFENRTRKKIDSSSLRPSRDLGLVFSSLPDEVTQMQFSGGDVLKHEDDAKQTQALGSVLLSSRSGSREIALQAANWERLLSEQGDAEEETRLFYVAATRAQDSLIFCGLVKDDADGTPHANTWTKLLLENIDHPEDFITEAAGINDYEYLGVSFQEEAKTLKPIELIRQKNSLRQISATSYSLFSFCPHAWRRKYKQGLNLSWENPDRDSEDEDYSGGAELGSLAHWALSRWPKNDFDALLFDRASLVHVPGYLRHTWRKNIAGKNTLRNWLKDFEASSLGQMLKSREDVLREHIFRLNLTEGISMAGAIDALCDDIVVDYKITSIDNAPSGLYEAQLEFYALVAHELTGAEKITTHVAFLRENTQEVREHSDFEAIRERVITAAEICASGPYTPSYNNCSLCPFKKGCAYHEE